MDGNEVGPGFAVPNLAHWMMMGISIALTVGQLAIAVAAWHSRSLGAENQIRRLA